LIITNNNIIIIFIEKYLSNILLLLHILNLNKYLIVFKNTLDQIK